MLFLSRHRRRPRRYRPLFVLPAAVLICLIACGTARAQTQIRVYPTELRIEKGKTATFTAVAVDRDGNYVPDQKFTFARSSGSPAIATVRRSPEGNTESNNSRFSHNLAEISANGAGVSTFVARITGLESPPVTVTVVDPAVPPFAVITGDTAGTNTVRIKVGEAVEVSAEQSSGTAAVEWTWGDGDRTAGLISATHAYLLPGEYQLRLKVTNRAGAVSETAARVLVEGFSQPVRTFTVTSIPQLLATYAQCNGGEEIVIPAGTILNGQVELPAREFSDFVTIRSSAAMPEIAVRADPTSGGYAIFRGSYPGEAPFIIKNRASKIRLSGLKFDPFPGSDDTIRNYYLLQIGEAFDQRTVADNPTRIIVDHCVVRPPDNIQVVHAVLNDGYKVSIVSSSLGNIRTYGGQDSQAVFSLDGRGAHVYNNTLFEAASESVIYGGAANRIDGLVPTNVEFRRCVFNKPVNWRQLPPNSVGDTINIKNLFETKNARRVYVEGSLFTNQWDAGRSQYYALVVKSTADVPGGDQGSPWAVSEEIIFENSRISHVNGGMSAAREFDRNNIEYDPLKPRDIRLVNTLFDDLTFGRWGETRSWAFHIGGVDDLSIRHVTVIDSIDTPDEPRELLLSLNSISSYRAEIVDSILPLNNYGIRNTCGEGVAALNVGSSGWFDLVSGSSCGASGNPASSTWNVRGNVFPRLRTYPVVGIYPSGNSYPADYSSVGMASYSRCRISYLDDECGATPSDFALREGSPYRNAASDLTDPGINAELLAERTRCTLGGDTRSCISVPTPVPAGGFEGDLAVRPFGDGSITPNDVAIIRNMVAGFTVPGPSSNEFQRADTAPYATRGDGILSAADIVQARHYALGIDQPTQAAGPGQPTNESPAVLPDSFRIIGADGAAFVEIDAPGDVAAFSFTIEYDLEIYRNVNFALMEGITPDAVLTVNHDRKLGTAAIVVDSGSVLSSGGNGRVLRIMYETTSDGSSVEKGFFISGRVAKISLVVKDGVVLPTENGALSESEMTLEGSSVNNDPWLEIPDHPRLIKTGFAPGSFWPGPSEYVSMVPPNPIAQPRPAANVSFSSLWLTFDGTSSQFLPPSRVRTMIPLSPTAQPFVALVK